MNLRNTAYLAQISACNAQVAAMNAENAVRQAAGDSPAYGHDHFLEQVQELQSINADIQFYMRMGEQ